MTSWMSCFRLQDQTLLSEGPLDPADEDTKHLQSVHAYLPVSRRNILNDVNYQHRYESLKCRKFLFAL